MKLRFRIPGLSSADLLALERKARLFLGRHAAAIEVVEVSLRADERGPVRHADCEIAVTLRDGSALRIHDDADHVHRALLRAAWRIDQRRELGRLREAVSAGAPRRPL